MSDHDVPAYGPSPLRGAYRAFRDREAMRRAYRRMLADPAIQTLLRQVADDAAATLEHLTGAPGAENGKAPRGA